jgi:hypothetical protein
MKSASMRRIYKNNKENIRNASQSDFQNRHYVWRWSPSRPFKQLSYREGKWDDLSRICKHKPICNQPVQHITAALHRVSRIHDETQVCIAIVCQQEFYFKGGMENTDFNVNKGSLFLMFCSKENGSFKRQPLLTYRSAKAPTIKENSRRIYLYSGDADI